MMPLERIPSTLPKKSAFLVEQMRAGVDITLARQRYAEHESAELWGSDRYLVIVYKDYDGEMNPVGGPRTMLSIRLVDGEPFANWADIQLIKNQLLGNEAELAMLFPAESRKVDIENQYWVYDNAGEAFPFGINRRQVH